MLEKVSEAILSCGEERCVSTVRPVCWGQEASVLSVSQIMCAKETKSVNQSPALSVQKKWSQYSQPVLYSGV